MEYTQNTSSDEETVEVNNETTGSSPKRRKLTPKEALEHLASIELIELCNEAKVERCRATRDLRSCGRYVESVLNQCGHGSLCAECCQRCDVCPICRIPIFKNGNGVRPRLYDECIEAGLISKRLYGRFQEKEGGENQLTDDVERLYSFFDVAIENNLVSLICHYITDVCMDESAVSSDPVIAFLLDEVVVKDWCKWTFKNILTDLQEIYNCRVREMETKLNLLLKFSVKLAGISNVLEVLESSFKGTFPAQLDDLNHLQENVLRTKQHMEMMIWCIRHQFLENVSSRHTTFASWRSHVRDRKSAAIMRSWPDSVNHSTECKRKDSSTLFIDDALLNLEDEQGYTRGIGGEVEIAFLQKDGGSSFFRSEIEGMAGCYPFENPRAATDILFLHGSSDLVVAKRAIFLYYLFDRHWTMPDEEWRCIVDDFAATFGIARHYLLESFTFYLLDDHTDEALQEACRLLPEISGPLTHSKVAQVLLERQNPDAALMVLRWSGRDGGAQLVSLSEAITAVRVRVECGLLTEAFMYQRLLCTKVREKKLKHGLTANAPDDLKDDSRTWVEWVEALVAEICCLCIRRNLVDKMIELPWNSDEEKYVHKSLLDVAMDDPSNTTGSLLVVFYLQRYRYIEAYQVDRTLQNVEQEFIQKGSLNEEVIHKMRSASHWRAGLVDKSIELLPEVQRQQVKMGKLPELVSSMIEVNNNAPSKSDPNSTTSLLVPSSVDSSLILRMGNNSTPLKVGEFVNTGNQEPSLVLRGSPFSNAQRGPKPNNIFNSQVKTTPGTRHVSPFLASPLKEFSSGSTFRVPPQNGSPLGQFRYDKVSPEKEIFQSTREYPGQIQHPTTTSPSRSSGLFRDSAQSPDVRVFGKRDSSDRNDRPRKVVPSDDPMDISSSMHGEKDDLVGDVNVNHELRWRSDETMEDEEKELSPDIITGGGGGGASNTTSMRVPRRSSRLLARR